MQSEEPIYDFHLTKEALKRKGIIVGDTRGYVVVKPADVIFKNGKGNVEFKNAKGDNGIFIKDKEGHFRQVFMYKRDYRLQVYGKPRYHICKCQVIQGFINSGGFNEHYRYANTETVMVYDIDDNNIDKEVVNLRLCSFCSKLLKYHDSKSMPLEKFVDILKKAGEMDPDESAKEVDIFGYVKDWPQISEAKRELNNYTCEKCGYHAKTILDRRFIQVHHLDGNKLNNNMRNLQCLCIKCHSNVDEKHKKNFGKGFNKDMLDEFESILL